MKVMLDSPDAILPTRAHKKDAGLDLYSTEEKIILPGETCHMVSRELKIRHDGEEGDC